MQRTKVAILGAGFITDIHMESYHRFVPEAEVVAVYARKTDKAKAFAGKYKIPNWYDDIDKASAYNGNFCSLHDIKMKAKIKNIYPTRLAGLFYIKINDHPFRLWM